MVVSTFPTHYFSLCSHVQGSVFQPPVASAQEAIEGIAAQMAAIEQCEPLEDTLGISLRDRMGANNQVACSQLKLRRENSSLNPKQLRPSFNMDMGGWKKKLGAEGLKFIGFNANVSGPSVVISGFAVVYQDALRFYVTLGDCSDDTAAALFAKWKIPFVSGEKQQIVENNQNIDSIWKMILKEPGILGSKDNRQNLSLRCVRKITDFLNESWRLEAKALQVKPIELSRRSDETALSVESRIDAVYRKKTAKKSYPMIQIHSPDSETQKSNVEFLNSLKAAGITVEDSNFVEGTTEISLSLEPVSVPAIDQRSLRISRIDEQSTLCFVKSIEPVTLDSPLRSPRASRFSNPTLIPGELEALALDGQKSLRSSPQSAFRKKVGLVEDAENSFLPQLTPMTCEPKIGAEVNNSESSSESSGESDESHGGRNQTTPPGGIVIKSDHDFEKMIQSSKKKEVFFGLLPEMLF